MPDTSVAPIVIDLGKIRYVEVERLRKGSGQIADDVKEIMRALSQKNLRGTNRVFLPIVTLYERQKKK
ncbi:MAG TPA: hypothetical protein VJ846_13750 [Sphingomicrobium sp.]|nr:hypothetical protein [Sphingomicrobium sp.]